MVETDVLNKFVTIKYILEQTEIWSAMQQTVEDSQWHREENVAVHTEMVCEYYVDHLMHHHNNKQQMLVLLTLLFHDTGKPAAMQERVNENGETSRRFSGHEQISSRIWEDFAVSNWTLLQDLFEFTAEDFYTIAWLIAKHLPYNLKHPGKIKSFITMIHNTCGMDVFSDVLLSDCCGRISDNHEDKIEHVVNWLSDINQQHNEMEKTSAFDTIENDNPTVYFLIGASGVGKSTFSKQMNLPIYSFDVLRSQLAKDNGVVGENDIESYKNSFFYATENKNEFDQYVTTGFSKMLESKQDFVVDNTNTSTKSRKNLIVQAQQKGYNVVGVLFPITIKELTKRRTLRTDKRVPLDVILRQNNNVSIPHIGTEVNEIQVSMDNIK